MKKTHASRECCVFLYVNIPTSTQAPREATRTLCLFITFGYTFWKAHAHNKDRTLAASMTPPPSPSTPKPSEANNPRERPHPLAKVQPGQDFHSTAAPTRILPTTPHIHHNARPISAARGRDRYRMVGRTRDNRTPFAVC